MKMVVVEGNSAVKDSRQGEADDHGEPLRRMVGAPRQVSQHPSKFVCMHLHKSSLILMM